MKPTKRFSDEEDEYIGHQAAAAELPVEDVRFCVARRMRTGNERDFRKAVKDSLEEVQRFTALMESVTLP